LFTEYFSFGARTSAARLKEKYSAITTPKPLEKTFGKHPTQKSLDLLKRIVLASTNEGDLILDPFTGSSTTGLAAYMYGRQFIGIDTEPKYLDLSIKRFVDLAKQLERKKGQKKLDRFD
jgi:site-specific DNA-methyltransferase (adenine-specific)